MVRTLLIVLIIGGIHWLANLGLLLLEMHTAGFLGIFHEPGHGLASGALRAIEFPLLRFLGSADDSWYLPVMILNSLLWGALVYAVLRAIRKRWRAAK
ncbi:MAG: hypothetical protein JSW50_03135 [Candidatus Latescibacterota bacterium]|nr:MAG: hypothetical protein JSW50_03135 [Candidatus Latescibacterota bacterium]